MGYVHNKFDKWRTDKKKKKKRDVEKQTYVYISLPDKMEKIVDRMALLRIEW